ncbi:hypothetical protein [Streptomyces clavuligerus]|uniref:WXG100 family type VII secretion target n=1 Tax=Streptomyces clavuligerus TaxID=1901 RepID=B5H2C9_STRCL|nr:hypothetical protein [Streptomyces clavuligerus]ANW21399.1 hypothetical protein BB341_25910 [Streptomyces clavuligerus]AXU16031.1 hypothetical protein D1794_26925 [Streptomyces clavuligerus]EDY52725.1 hypothetical protein SSCG_05753 [Streptomyces clavuligerus]EFG05454.1 Hypothetical protein SCLAV_0378 [Streptomyces clavuligerus]MBY6306166.1 hypothetical protein [Streptomyces clavuligerus]
MSSGHGPSFEADPARLSAFITDAHTLCKQLRHVADNFAALVAPTSMWYGVDDDYAKEMGPQAHRERGYVQSGLNLVADGFGASIEGHFAALRKVSATQSQNLDDINLLKGRIDSVGEGGGTGGGKH